MAWKFSQVRWPACEAGMVKLSVYHQSDSVKKESEICVW